MRTGILIIAHAPLASALQACVLHVFPDVRDSLAAFDVQPNAAPEDSLSGAAQQLATLKQAQILIVSDLFGATPCNVAKKLACGDHIRLIAGVNLPMLLRSVTCAQEPLDALVARALAGGAQGIVPVLAATSSTPTSLCP
jgi:PTS system ascorbate-specific IIA component